MLDSKGYVFDCSERAENAAYQRKAGAGSRTPHIVFDKLYFAEGVTKVKENLNSGQFPIIPELARRLWY